MGTSGMFLKKTNHFNTHKTLEEIEHILKTLGFRYCVYPVSSNNKEFHLGINDPLCHSDFCMYIFDVPEYMNHPKYVKDNTFSWISPDIEVAVLIEDIFDSEESILKILHQYLNIHPDEYFYAEENWFYDKEIIDRIYESNEWYHWCYRKPEKHSRIKE